MSKYSGIPFDQYQRYGVAAKAVEAVRQEGKALKILEVGANTHHLLGKLLPNDSIDYLDLEVPVEMQGIANVVQGDATALTLADNSYDIVVALDVYEHIPMDKREFFLHHISRVGKLLTLIGAPFDKSQTIEAEKRASNYHEKLFGTKYRWLEEHAIHGLPNMSWSIQYLNDSNFFTANIKHGNIKIWETLISAHFAKEFNSFLKPIVSFYDQYYNEYLFEKDFHVEHAYREFIFVSKYEVIIKNISNIFNEFSIFEEDKIINDSQLLFCKLIVEATLEICIEMSVATNDTQNSSLAALNKYKMLVNSNLIDNDIYINSFKNNMKIKMLLTEHEHAKNTVKNLSFDLESAKQNNLLLMQQISNMHQSTSWRATRLLRYVGKQFN